MKWTKSLFIVFTLFAALLLAACSAAATPAANPADTGSTTDTTDTTSSEPADTTDTTDTTTDDTVDAEPTSVPTPTPGVVFTGQASMPDRIPVRWYVGVGTGSDIPQLQPQQDLVDEYNNSQDEIELILEVVDNDVAFDVLNTQIAAGNAPDLVGPMGIRGRDSFPGAWADMAPFVEKYNFDLSDFDPELIDFYQVKGEGQLGLPFAVYPSFVYVNKDLFDEAGLPYPPTHYGDPYIDENGDEHEWNLETLRDLGMKLTVDANGNDATSPDFDPENIVQFGYGGQWTDMRGRLTLFGASNLIDDDGNASLSDSWREGIQWYHDGIWVDHYQPSAAYGASDILNAGNWFSSGNIAMDHIHTWYAPGNLAEAKFQWGAAVLPSYEGTATAKLHADTFGILKSGKQQEAAFRVLQWMLTDKAAELAQFYGGMPARSSLQDTYFDNLTTQFPGQDIDWAPVTEGLSHPDNPNHETGLPSSLESIDRYTIFWQELENNPDMDIDAQIESLLKDLQGIYDAAK